jgi:hypothetical protein
VCGKFQDSKLPTERKERNDEINRKERNRKERNDEINRKERNDEIRKEYGVR